MSTIHDLPSSLRQYLEASGARYQVLHHARDYSAQQTATDTHTPRRCFAKCVLVWADNEYAMIVLPADRRVDPKLLERALGAQKVCFVHEQEMQGIFPDCELGAEPPFGGLYGVPVFVDAHLANEQEITFNAGSHEVAVCMQFADFERITKSSVIHCSG